MRITEKFLSEKVFSEIVRAREKMNDIQLDIATGKKFRKPSSDPTVFLQSAKFKHTFSRNEQFVRNIDNIVQRIGVTTTALNQAYEIVVKAKQIAVQGSFDLKSGKSFAKNIDQLIDELLSIANTEFNNNYIFGGTKIKGEPPFVRQENEVVYQGNQGVIKNQIGPGVLIEVNKPGSKVFTTPAGTDMFNTLNTVKKSLENGNSDEIQNIIKQLDEVADHILSVSSEFGVLNNRLELAKDFLNNQNLNLANAVSKLEDTDLTKAAIDLQNARNVYTVGLRSFSELINLSLLDFLQ